MSLSNVVSSAPSEVDVSRMWIFAPWRCILEQVPVQLSADRVVMGQRVVSPFCSGQQLVHVGWHSPVWKWV